MLQILANARVLEWLWKKDNSRNKDVARSLLIVWSKFTMQWPKDEHAYELDEFKKQKVLNMQWKGKGTNV